MDSTTTIIGSLKKKKSKIKKKRLGSCFGPIVAECASRRADHGIVPFSPRGSDIAGGKDQFHRRSLSGVVKAMLFGTSMAKKFRKAKQRGKIDQTGTDSNANSKPKSNPQKTPETSLIPLETSSSSFRKTRSSSSLSTSAVGFCTSSSSLKSSSSSSYSSSSSMSKEPVAKSMNCYGSDVGLCLVLISLLVLVLWGKICAIVCTSSWLFFVPKLKLRFRPSNCVAMEVYSKEDKKKVVLEGLLERNRLVREQSKLC